MYKNKDKNYPLKVNLIIFEQKKGKKQQNVKISKKLKLNNQKIQK